MRDLRKYTHQTITRLIIGAILLVMIVGSGLILVIYGPGEAASSILCLGVGLLPIILIVVILWILDWIVKKARPDE